MEKKKGKGKIMHEIKNNKFDEILLSEESKQKIDQDLKQNGIKSTLAKKYLEEFKKMEPEKYEKFRKESNKKICNKLFAK
ncbi:piwi protein (plasmid) [Mesomycoplasma conjunctivae]|nr:hypothetical protein [Mycoplasmopsis fermentans]VEU67265.1 piwi protein [Mesomycoplasma conjunctivae]AAN85264.1 ICEF-II ORF8 [Mycoplasmopsis fermentans]ADV34454.1 Hypothetical Protein MfeM64YM_0455 [Mycoplasmopsis fermentans M64]ADV34793.1 Hypothetical Protein MfeM64YM_0798 [Mycoplasmopsis fermentans M64]ADV34845.1 Hypothetical Protein MfeM64YM_0850 [Mycoplasmopsis fermentans M64]